ncbi:UMP kinase [Streptobacillus felis]|uniref:UMP kinase n=1 Tax=Streptobacillus felis TaxID=1384509 RepID=UPI00082FE8E2|nr:UMP kinase [Streptobacillus felis]
MLKHKRILLKLSGEALAGDKDLGFSDDILHSFAKQIKEIHDEGVELAIVIGGGNIFRGKFGEEVGMDRSTGDTMGMLATIMNGLALQNAIEKIGGVSTRVLTAISMPQVAEPFIRRRAIRHLEKCRVVIFAGGTGNPYFTTDSGGALRAIEIEADVLAKGTKVDGIYDKDPVKFPDAVKFEEITFKEALSKDLKVMDATALSLCRENDMPIIVFNALKDGNMLKLAKGEKIGTLVKND